MQKTHISKKIIASIAMGIFIALPVSQSFASYGSSIVTTPLPTTVISSGGNNGGGGGGISSFRGTGGGAGSMAFTLLNTIRPDINIVSPSKNSIIDTLDSVQFTTSQNIDVNTVSISINGHRVPVSVSPSANGYIVTALSIPSEITRKGSNIIQLSATGERYRGTVTTLYRVDITNNEEINYYNYYNEVTTPPILPNEQIAIATPAPLAKINACGKGEVSLDGTHNTEKTYGDIEGHWAKEYILDLTKRCIVHGRELGTGNNFQPDEVFNRAEAAKVLVKTYSLYTNKVASTPFTDIQADKWYAPYIVSARRAGLIQGYADGSYHPERGVSRVEALAMVARAQGVDISKYSGNSGFIDVNSNEWYAPYIAWAKEKGMVSNNSGQFNPGMVISRAEYAMMVSLSIR